MWDSRVDGGLVVVRRSESGLALVRSWGGGRRLGCHEVADQSQTRVP